MKLTENTIFITGGTSGIGRALAEAFHLLGNKVIIGGRRKNLLDEVTTANPGMESIEFDVSDLASIEAAAATIIAKYPSLNVLVNNAGIMPFDDAAGKIDDVVSRKILDTNLLGPIRLSSALVEHLKSQPRATIIHNTSVLAYVPLAVTAVYSASKAGLHSYAMSQRFMLRDTSVRVQEIAPPWVDTDLVKKSGDPRAMPLDAFIKETMAKLAGDDEEVIVDAIKPMSREYLQGVTADKLEMKLEKPIVDQLKALGLKPGDIDYVGLSHAHFDHTGQSNEFPDATMILQC